MFLAEAYVKWATSEPVSPTSDPVFVLVVGMVLVLVACGTIGIRVEGHGERAEKIGGAIAAVLTVTWASFSLITICCAEQFCRFFGWLG